MICPRLVLQWGLGSSPCFATSWLCGQEQKFDQRPEPPFFHLENSNKFWLVELK